jgi:hypothetical protein
MVRFSSESLFHPRKARGLTEILTADRPVLPDENGKYAF